MSEDKPVLFLPSDNSRDSQVAVQEGIALARLIGGSVVCAAVQSTESDDPEDARVGPGEAESAVQLARVEGSRLGVDVEATILTGDPRDSLLREIRHRNAIDLVVMGSHGRSGIDRLFMGSVTEAMVRRSGVPVLVLNQYSRRQFGPIVAGDVGVKILATTDGSEVSRAGVEVALRWAGLLGTDLHLLGVDHGDHKVTEAIQKMFHEASKRGAAASIQVLVEIVKGQPLQEILHYSQQHDVDILVMSTHGRGLGDWMFGSITRAVFQRSLVPVMAVPRQDRS